jgi:hypothetical protein
MLLKFGIRIAAPIARVIAIITNPLPKRRGDVMTIGSFS